MISILIAEPLLSPTVTTLPEYIEYFKSDKLMNIMDSDYIKSLRELVSNFNDNYKDHCILNKSEINDYISDINYELESIINEANSDILFNAYFWLECISVVEINKSYCKILKTHDEDWYKSKIMNLTENFIIQYQNEDKTIWDRYELLFIIDISIIERAKPFVCLQPGQY